MSLCDRCGQIRECLCDAEIAWLRPELKAALAFLTSDPETLHSECDCQIERLRAELKAANHDLDLMLALSNKQKAVVEWLTQEVGDLAKLAGKQASKLTEAEAVVRAAENYHGCTKAQPIAAGKCVMCDTLAALRRAKLEVLRYH